MHDQECWLPVEREEREVLVKKESKTNWNYGEDPWNRTIEKLLNFAFINLDKPHGPTSHQVAAWIKEIIGTKVGHGGTLDPKVTGILPVFIGKATKLSQVMLKAGKEYVALMHLHKPVPEEKIYETAEKFTGEIIQKPPLKSAVKKRPRRKKVYCIKILEIENNRYVLMRVSTEAGVYIRKLIHDMGKYLGVGAHMQELRRTKVGLIREDCGEIPLVTLQDIVDSIAFWRETGNEKYIRKVFLPPEVSVMHLPKVWVLDTTIGAITYGANVMVPGIAKLHSRIKKGDLVAVMSLKDELVALGIAQMSSEEIMNSDKGLAIDVERVILEKGLYPKVWKSKTKSNNN